VPSLKTVLFTTGEVAVTSAPTKGLSNPENTKLSTGLALLRNPPTELFTSDTGVLQQGELMKKERWRVVKVASGVAVGSGHVAFRPPALETSHSSPFRAWA
jgi:hypothetical protein